MLKILCLLIFLANLFLFMWEYRSGAFSQPESVQTKIALKGKESIVLWDERKAPQSPAGKTDGSN